MAEPSDTRRIFLDTNAVEGRPGDVRYNDLRDLGRMASTLGASCIINQVTLDEVERHVGERATKTLKDMDSGQRWLQRLLPEDVEVTWAEVGPVSHISWQTRLGVRRFLHDHGYLKSSYAEVSHASLVHRDLARRKPFRETGKGYRDALIWESIKGLLDDFNGEIILISADGDFTTKKGALAADLKEELEGLGFTEEQILVFKSIDQALQHHLSKQMPANNALVGQPIQNTVDTNQRQALRSLIVDACATIGELYNLPGSLASEHEEEVGHVFTVDLGKITNITTIDDENRALWFTATIGVSLEWDEPLDHQMMGRDAQKAYLNLQVRTLVDATNTPQSVSLGRLEDIVWDEFSLTEIVDMQGPEEEIEDPFDEIND